MNETKTEWRDCADPDELAAAVAAGVEVEVQRRAVREFAAKVADYVSTHQNADGMSKRGWAIEAVVQALEEPTASQEARSILAPTPPWPGAVLSGLVDEDGVPTWLAQAGNVQGESVRTCADFPWFVCGSDNASDRTWVEVRAPRAVPEPETERVEPVTVRFYEAFGPTDFTDGRGPRKSMGVYPTEQEAWDSINDLPGVQGTHPSKGNTHPLRSREYEDCGPVLTWQRYREVVGRSGDYYVVERQVVGTPLKATP